MFSIGIDFGTESARGLLVELATGREAAAAVYAYRHGVMDRELPSGEGAVRLGPDWALQDPEDYLRALQHVVPALLKQSGVDGAAVVGLGVDATSCTMLPVRGDGLPLCLLPEYRANPHAWVKLWKHHAAQGQADRMNALARAREEPWLPRYGGRISSEWLFPKILQVLEEAPEVYAAADRFLEAADWIVWRLTGEEALSSATAGYKALWVKGHGFPEAAFFGGLDARLEGVVRDKLPRRVLAVGTRAGELTGEAAAWTGLPEGTPVAVPLIDAHASVPGAGVTEPGRMVMIMGTSICQMVLGREARPVEGIAGVVEDGIVPGLFGYEAGQPSLGDTFAWAARTLAGRSPGRPGDPEDSAFRVLEAEAAGLAPGASGLLALDWWNGNRSVLDDAGLTGLLVGATLATTAAEIYRALMEASAFGTRLIVDAYAAQGIGVDECVACGGLADKSDLLLQIYADVLGREIRVAASGQTSAHGAALFGAVAAGAARGGYDTVEAAAERMARLKERTFRPVAAHGSVYDRLFDDYRRLYDYFGRGGNDVMKTLKRLRSGALPGAEGRS